MQGDPKYRIWTRLFSWFRRYVRRDRKLKKNIFLVRRIFSGVRMYNKPTKFDEYRWSHFWENENLKYFLIFYPSSNIAPKPNDQSCSNSIFRILLQFSPASPFHFQPILNIKGILMLSVVHIKNKKQTELEFYKHGHCFCCYVIKSEEEIAKKVLLSLIWNLLLIEIKSH